MGNFEIALELNNGGEWLSAARNWMQSNIHRGDTLCWSSEELVQIPFCALEGFALRVAAAAVAEDRRKRATHNVEVRGAAK